jgi:hypothetical protein
MSKMSRVFWMDIMCTMKLNRRFDETKDELTLLIYFLLDHSVPTVFFVIGLFFTIYAIKHCYKKDESLSHSKCILLKREINYDSMNDIFWLNLIWQILF